MRKKYYVVSVIILCIIFLTYININLGSESNKNHINDDNEATIILQKEQPKNADLELPDKVYTFTQGSDSLSFDLFFKR